MILTKKQLQLMIQLLVKKIIKESKQNLNLFFFIEYSKWKKQYDIIRKFANKYKYKYIDNYEKDINGDTMCVGISYLNSDVNRIIYNLNKNKIDYNFEIDRDDKVIFFPDIEVRKPKKILKPEHDEE